MSSLFGRFQLLPLLVLVSFFSFAVRFVDVVTDIKTVDQVVSASVVAEEKKEVVPVSVPEGLPETDSIPLPVDNWADPATLDMQFTDTQSSVLKELAERRKELDARENRINQREALLQVTEKQIQEKTSELTAIRTQIEELLDMQSDAEEARLKSLVKIYEGMKPKDAASIFDNLDIDILLQVVGRMSERKSAPIMAAMDTQRVQKLTILLAEQKKLPEIPE
jgi:flagellar motility protein MotE (MotC chaperone)